MSKPRYKAPVQARAEATQDRLFEATERLLREHAFAELSLTTIAREAGVTTGAIFARFADKDSLLLGVNDWLAQSVAEEAERVLNPRDWAAAPLSRSLQKLFEATIAVHRRHAGVIRAVAERRHYPALRDSIAAANLARLERIRVCVRSRRRNLDDATIDFAVLLCVGVIRNTVVFDEFWPRLIPKSDRVLARELTRAFMAYVGGRAGVRGRGVGG